jgi:hypothetical protein
MVLAMNARRFALLGVPIAVAAAIALPALAASPSPATPAGPKGSPPGQTKPAKAAKPEKQPEVAATVRGTVVAAKDGQGRTSFTITANGTTWQLSAGPAWFWGDQNPLMAFVGKTVTIAGTHAVAGTDLDVETVDGSAIREPGKPPWAGGPWVVGPSHPGWKDWMADGKPGKGLGRDSAPGQNKEKPAPSGG